VARNVEIKARIASVEALTPIVAGLADRGPIAIAQDDTFFACADGRLKLRDFGDGTGELIFYRRDDGAGPKVSRYVRVPTFVPEALRDCLALAHGTCARVRKQRTLFVVGRTRVHLDRVDGLGDFLELEVVLDADEPADAGHAEARRLMAALGIGPADLVEGAYVDLVAAARR
jgi:adenylate cyclase class IV